MGRAILKSAPAVLAFGLLAVAAPAVALAQPQPPTACGSGAAACPPDAETRSDAASDEAAAAPAELRIDQPFGHAWLGAADADVTLVVFADYGCPACRVAQSAIDALLAHDARLRVVYRLLDNDQGGRAAALTSLAVARQGADWARFHHALDTAGNVSATSIAGALAASGVAPGALRGLEDEDPESLALVDELSRNDNLITQRSGTAIPAWVIGDGPAQRGFDLPRLQAAIARARAGGNR